MKRSTAWTAKWIVILSILSNAGAARADVKLIHVYVKGMVCGFCANGLKKTFEKEPSVASLKVSLEEQEVKLFIKDGKEISDLEIENAVKNAGFSLNKIER